VGAAAVYQASEELSPVIRRSMMLNGFFSHGTRWGNAFGVLGFLYTGYYVFVRDKVYEAEYFKGDPRADDKEWCLINTVSGFATGLTYKLSGTDFLQHFTGYCK